MPGPNNTAVTLEQNDALQKEREQAKLDAEREAESILASAKQIAQDTVSRAEAEAEQVREQAAKEKQQAISEVRGHIEAILSTAKDEAAKVVADAKRKAEEEANDIVARARREAEALTEASKRESGTVANAASQPTEPQESGDAKPHRKRKPPDSPGEGTKPAGALPVASPPDESVLYYGEVELRISIPPDGAAVRELEDRLRAVPYLGVTRPQLSETGSVSLVVHARAPTPLLRIVKSTAIVKDAVPAGKDIEVTLNPGRKGQEANSSPQS